MPTLFFCLDASSYMAPYFDELKKGIKEFYYEFVSEAANKYCCCVKTLNIKVIAFRNYVADGAKAMMVSKWFDVTTDGREQLNDFLAGIEAEGGSSEANGLEALYFAMTTDWRAIDSKDRQIIVLMSDADAVDLLDEHRYYGSNYPSEMVDFDGLVALWAGELPPYMAKEDYKLRQRTKRMVLFAPAETKYEELARHCSNTFFIPVPFCSGLIDLEIDDIVREMSASCAG